MQEVSKSTFKEIFDELADPRIERKKLYPLIEILLIVICGTICGAESWRDFVLCGNEKLEYLRKFFSYQNGIPCKNTFARVFAALNPESFKYCFLSWIQSMQEVLKGFIAIDGKTLRGSFDSASNQSAIHMVSAFATEARLVLGQEKVNEKSNEITAIPKLLKLLDIRGCIVSIDAMGTQKAIAEQIRDQEGDYVLALKGNQGTLHEDVQLFLDTEIAKQTSSKITDFCEEFDKGHGRIETRKCYVSDQLDWLEQKSQWKDLKTIAIIEEKREINGKISVERRYFISSLPAKAKQIAYAVRMHWGIENNLHWVLDMTFREDESRIRTDHAPENMGMIKHIALNMLRNGQKKFKNISLKGLRKKAGWGDSTLDLILAENF
jgi:predicted transposase YbfD/YdcC